MQRRTKILLAMLMASVGGPYLMSSGGPSQLVQWLKGLVPAADTTLSVESGSLADNEHSAAETTDIGSVVVQPDTRPFISRATNHHVTSLYDALNFHMTSTWVINRWPHVSTSLADFNLQGMRVALVTGTGMDDVHGSLSYYFDDRHRLQRLQLYGHTGDPTKLIELITDEHGFKQQRTLDAGLYLKRWNGRPTGVLSIEHAPVIRAESLNSRYSIKLEINRTDGRYQLSEEFTRLLDERRQAGRW